MGKKRKKSTNNGTYKNRKTRNKTVEKRGNKDAKAKRKDTKMKLKYKHPKLALFLKINKNNFNYFCDFNSNRSRCCSRTNIWTLWGRFFNRHVRIDNEREFHDNGYR